MNSTKCLGLPSDQAPACRRRALPPASASRDGASRPRASSQPLKVAVHPLHEQHRCKEAVPAAAGYRSCSAAGAARCRMPSPCTAASTASAMEAVVLIAPESTWLRAATKPLQGGGIVVTGLHDRVDWQGVLFQPCIGRTLRKACTHIQYCHTTLSMMPFQARHPTEQTTGRLSNSLAHPPSLQLSSQRSTGWRPHQMPGPPNIVHPQVPRRHRPVLPLF